MKRFLFNVFALAAAAAAVGALTASAFPRPAQARRTAEQFQAPEVWIVDPTFQPVVPAPATPVPPPPAPVKKKLPELTAPNLAPPPATLTPEGGGQSFFSAPRGYAPPAPNVYYSSFDDGGGGCGGGAWGTGSGGRSGLLRGRRR